MKQKSKLLLMVAFVLPFLGLSSSMVSAVEGHGMDTPISSDQQTTTKKTREERLAERKAEVTQRLTQIQEVMVKGRCKAVSVIITNARSRITKFEEKRPPMYSTLVVKLERLGEKLKAADIDTATYDQQVSELETLVNDFAAEMDALKLAADDLAGMDCSADPQGFVATIKDAVNLRKSVIEKGREIRMHIKDTLKPTLATIRTELQAKASTSEGQ